MPDNKKPGATSDLCMKLCFILSVIFIFAALINYNKEFWEAPVLASQSLTNKKTADIHEYIKKGWNDLRLVVEYEKAGNEFIDVPIEIEFIKGNKTVFSEILNPESGAGYTRKMFPKKMRNIADYGRIHIRQSGNYLIRLTPTTSISKYNLFLVIITKNSSDNKFKIFLVLSVVFFLAALYLGRNMKMTVK